LYYAQLFALGHLTTSQASALKRYAPALALVVEPSVRQRLLLQARQELQQVRATLC
jgi:hypothetical protein